MQSTASAQSHVMHQHTADDAVGYSGDEIHWKLCPNSKVQVQTWSNCLFLYRQHEVPSIGAWCGKRLIRQPRQKLNIILECDYREHN